MIRWSSLAGGLILVIGVLLKIPWLMIVTLALSGLITGVFIPLIIDTAGSWYPFNTGTITSILYLSINLSNMFFPWMIGIIAEGFSLQWGIILTACILPSLFVISYVME